MPDASPPFKLMPVRPAMVRLSVRSPRLFVEGDLAEGAVLACSREQASYLANVLRLRAGDTVLLFNGREGEWEAAIEAPSKRALQLVSGHLLRPQESGPDIDYLFAPLKHARLDYMVQKATEMGAARLRPVLTERTQAERVNLDRMRANAIEAAEQCGILSVPEVMTPEPLDSVLARWPADRTLVFCDEAAPLADPIAALSRSTNGAVAILIGPEGGFTAGERARISALPSSLPVRLGPRIMRADTAAVAALALVGAVLGDWRDRDKA